VGKINKSISVQGYLIYGVRISEIEPDNYEVEGIIR
jgi:hypothetical protein